MAITKLLIEGLEYDIKDAALSLALAQHISSGGTSHSVATESQAGFLSAEDKTKLDGVATEANKYTLTNEFLSEVLVASAESEISDADTLPFVDSSDTNVIKKISIANLFARLKSFFDTLYNNYVLPIATKTTLGGVKIDDSTIKINNGEIYSTGKDYLINDTLSGVASFELIPQKIVIISNALTSLTLTIPSNFERGQTYAIETRTSALTLPTGYIWDGEAPTLDSTKWYTILFFDGIAFISQGVVR